MIRYVTQVGGQNENVTFRYKGGRGVKNDQILRYVIFGRPLTFFNWIKERALCSA